MALMHLQVRVYGIVQGVGFRPFVRNLAVRLGVDGTVCNKGPYVEIEVQGGEQKLAAFLQSLKSEAPLRAELRKIETKALPVMKYDGFSILKSEQSEGEVFPSPDIGICDDCARELFDKNDRRYLHPFINCTSCGPRLTILDEMPYDRAKTSMASFKMCGDCEKEYTSPENRRFHAQPVCCNGCGPSLEIIYPDPAKKSDPIPYVREIIRGGGIAAVKGIGGFHLCCDAKNAVAVKRLRGLKKRPQKPFAVMVRDEDAALRECKISRKELEILSSPQKPILLMEKSGRGEACEGVAPGVRRLGVMLPYAPVQLLLFRYPDGRDFTDCLVMTSGNPGGEPICKNGEEALSQLTAFCDVILSNDREIRTRADDTVMASYKGAPYMLRRSRGYAPQPVDFIKSAKKRIFAVGGELKNAFCMTSGDKMYLSSHIGDLSGVSSVKALRDTYERFKRLLRIEPDAAVCDLHPGYNSAAFAKSLGLPVLQVQHHYAHIASCMAENGLDGSVIGVAFDGVGYGTDGTVWGGEFLAASYLGFERLLSIDPFILAGGDAAARECFRPATGILAASCGVMKAREYALALGICSPEQFAAEAGLIKSGFNSVTCTSVGRLFDAASAVLGIRLFSTYEGESAAVLQSKAEEYAAGGGSVCMLPDRSTNDIIKEMAKLRIEGESPESLALAFHEALARFVARGCLDCRKKTGLNRVVLSGGVFANLLLLDLCKGLLENEGFKVFIHSCVPCSDGGIALGQAAIEMYRE